MYPLNILIKPASSSCNLACRYCFYHDVSGSREVENYGVMKIETLEALIRKAFDEHAPSVTFAFQGGEPTLCGLDFYRSFVDLVKKYNKKNSPVYLALQTNGMLIDDQWAAFLKENNFLTGISLDGHKALHDLNRVDHEGLGSFGGVMKAVAALDRHNAEYNILSVVTQSTAKHADKVYNFFKKNNFKYLQFIPCIDDLGAQRGNRAFSLTPELYEGFLKQLFDRWYDDFMKEQGISIRTFDNWLGVLGGYPPESCAMRGVCSCSFTVESDGGVYPCDFYVLDEWKLGNVHDDSFSAMRESATAARFIKASAIIPEKCADCRYLRLCRNGCRRERELLPDGSIGINYYCRAYESFFDYSVDRFMKILTLI